MASGWEFDYLPSPALPPLAWIASVAGSTVRVRCGGSVRTEANGFVEGAWVGPSDLGAMPGSTTVFGSGVVAEGESLIVVPPSHPLERIYIYGGDGATVVSNSLAAVIETCGLELDPDTLYPPIFIAAAEGVRDPILEIPTNYLPISAAAYYNVRLTANDGFEVGDRPREQPFMSFEEYRTRLSAALASIVAKTPGYEMVVSLSSGYDSTAVAAVGAPLGCTRAVTFRLGKPVHGNSSLDDSGESTARRLGMTVDTFDRLDYTKRTDIPEAEFLATGMSGEDVVMVAMEGSIGRSLLLTGSEAFRLKGNPFRPGLYRGDLSACSQTEFRLRTDFVHVPLLFFGASEQPSLLDIIASAEMRPYTVRGRYDKPIQRRLAEEAGIPRGSFATVKRRASARIHTEGLAAMAPESAAAVISYAHAEGREPPSGNRPPMERRHRLALRIARELRLQRLTVSLTRRRRALIHSEPMLGSLLFRWAISVVRTRYSGGRSDIIPGC